MQARSTSPRRSGFGPRRPSARAATAIVVLVALAVGFVALAAGPGRAQDEPADPGSMVMEVIAAPFSHGPQDRLGVRLRITNGSDTALEAGRIRVGIRDRVLSRSALQESYEAAPGFESSALPVDLPEPIGPGETRAFVVNEPVASFPTLAGAIDGGVFPATFSLQEETGTVTFASLTVPLIYHPEPPERPLDVHVVLPLDDIPSRDPSGSFVARDGDEPALVEAVSEEGPLDGYLDALEEMTRPPRPLRISVAPSPRLLEELGDLADGAPVADGEDLEPDAAAVTSARRTLARMRAIFALETVDPLLVPYGSPDLPTLVGNLPLRQTVEQFAEADDVWETVMETVPVADWVYPPDGRLDAASLEQLQLLRRGRKIVLNQESLVPLAAASEGCPEPFLSFTCAVRVGTDAGPAEGLVTDEVLDRMLDRLGGSRGEDRLTLAQVFAESAMVHAEIPGTEGRVLQITIPSAWDPTPGFARALLRGLRGAPWLRTRSADGALDVSSEVTEREIVDRAPPLAGGPDDAFYSRVEEARALLDSYASIVPPGSPRLQRLRRNILVASSTSWLRQADQANAYLTQSMDEVRNEFGEIGVTGASDITLTSKSGPLQIVITNDTGTSARLALRFVSPDLRFRQERIVDTYEPGSHPLTLEPTATGSGVFQLVVRLETPDGYLVDERRIVVRSTSFNQVALGLTVGAFAFLVLFYVFKAVRKRARESGGTNTQA